MSTDSHQLIDNLLYSCIDARQRGHEQFVPEHTLGYIISGESRITINNEMHVVKAGTIGLVRKNQLLKSVKIPPADGLFKSINIDLNQEVLRQYSNEHNIMADKPYENLVAVNLGNDPFLKGYFESLLPYFEQQKPLRSAIAQLKTQEAIELLLAAEPNLKNLLFDFSEPHKIDLEAFMNQHYTYNVSQSQFAKLTGRSLASFKRDFEKIFHCAPGQWLLQKRLREAYYLIKEKGRKASDIYLDIGFENLSHFSFAFKKAYGVPPSMAAQLV